VKKISAFILKMLGWQIRGPIPSDLKKYIIAVVPHTSNWDFPLGILVKWALGLNVNFIGKHSLFKWPHGFIFYWLGGQPVDRSKSSNYVDQIVDVFNSKESFALAIAPEGTRKKVEKLKTGFYHIAKKAKVPLILTKMDFGSKTIEFREPFYPTEDIEDDFSLIHKYFEGAKGFKPEYGFGVKD